MAIIETWLNQDINEAVKVRYIDGNMFSMDNGGNRINVTVMDGDSPATVGGSVSANVIRSDGSTVAVTGTLEDNVASVVLPQACYVIPGVISIVIKITEDTTVTTIAAVIANVYQSTTDSVVDPGTIIPSIQDLIAQIEAAVATIPVSYSDLMADIAPTYSSSSLYAVGQYAWYDGDLKRCIVPITTAESYTAAHWTNAVIGNDVSDLKSALFNTNILLLEDNYVGKGQINSDGSISYGANNSLYSLKISGCKRLGITTGSSAQYFAVLSAFSYGTQPTYSSTTGFTSRLSVTANKTKYYDLPNDAQYILLQAPLANSVVVDGYDFAKSAFQNYINTDELAKLDSYKYIRSVVTVPLERIDIFRCIKDISIKVPSSISSHNFLIQTFIYNTSNNRLYIRLYDATTNTDDAYAYKQYISMPTAGIERIIFGTYSGKQVDGEYKFCLLIDWSKYSSSIAYENETSGSPQIRADIENSLEDAGIYCGYSTPLEDIIADATILNGNFTLNSAVTLKAGQNLIGENCVVTCGANAKITMEKGSGLTGIRFVGNWNVTRTEGDGTTYTRYGFVPLVSMSDLSTGGTDTICGTGKTWANSLIHILPDNAYNVKIDSCRFENFENPVIYAGGRRHQSTDNPIICNNYFSDCWCAIGVFGEFERIYANEYYRCIIGTYLYSGNSNQVSEIYKCCDCGIYFPASAGAHNEITSVQICHCGLAGIYAKEIANTLGCQVTGCHIADAAIIGESVSNLLITSGRFDTYFKYDSGQHNSIICSNIRRGYVYGHDLFDVPSDTQITLNRGMGETADNVVNWT